MENIIMPERLEWEIPAGKIEEGESPEEAARRECIEETGCSLKDVSFLCSQNPANGMLIILLE
ncbi:NUDIX domain-containing protein [Butyrivibrio sp. INlla16]|uniref:NUDIX domain-containing protein n=1 Tax=Butyrivibrio sp. INlla16 TaxID=1520807 RepID=UPI000882EE88|nr:NUDIX domain-containing protein [Butyrivibrio sp. INlla16]SDB68974.1 NUDIX domain-containing protein [Butyrivibrio sp. INlla16]